MNLGSAHCCFKNPAGSTPEIEFCRIWEAEDPIPQLRKVFFSVGSWWVKYFWNHQQYDFSQGKWGLSKKSTTTHIGPFDLKTYTPFLCTLYKVPLNGGAQNNQMGHLRSFPPLVLEDPVTMSGERTRILKYSNASARNSNTLRLFKRSNGGGASSKSTLATKSFVEN